MTDLLQAAKMALDVLEHEGFNPVDLRQAIAQAEQNHSGEASEMVAPEGYALVSVDALKAWGKYDEVRNACQFPVEQAEQEPVIGAYEVVNEKCDEWSLVYPAAVHKYKSIPEERITQTFYAAPVRTKDLTDEEIQKWIDVLMYDPPEWALKRFARAVIAADREKNK